MNKDEEVAAKIKKIREGLQEQHDIEIDRAVAQCATSAIATRGQGDKDHLMFLAVNVILYVNAIGGIQVDEFIDLLREGSEHSNIKAKKDIVELVNETEDDEVPEQNAPSNNSIN